MTYQETLDFLFNALPMFQRVGSAAFKKDLSNTQALCALLGHPENKIKTVHVAGTNGKGSTSHAICSVLMEAGYQVGLYTSPHLKSFTERIKINGKEIPEKDVVDFVEKNRTFLEDLKPSFFEMTVAMAFWFFEKEEVDIAVIEVGMGGRLDSTNVIVPEVAVITNIGFDHMQFLGDTLEKISEEKAGIIKADIPVVISSKQTETTPVFLNKAKSSHSPIFFAEDEYAVKKIGKSESGKNLFKIQVSDKILFYELDLLGNYQGRNLPGILSTLDILREKNWKISNENISKGLSKVKLNTGLKGRWDILGESPWVICDTGHNEDGIRYIVEQISEYPYKNLFVVLGMVNDKDITKILCLLPKNAHYIFCQANIPRALDAMELAKKAGELGLKGDIVRDVNEALLLARKKAGKEDFIFIGGSTFVVAEINEL
jgi:dihydrofolate synthase / folylpolyglutamate synthase